MATKLGKKLNLPVFHMDKLFWLPNWVERSKPEMAVDVEKILVEQRRWVIDGNYKKVAFQSRIQASDLVIILSYGFLVCIWRILKRNIIHWNKTRPDMGKGCMEKIDLEFLNYVWTYPRRTLKPIEDVLKSFPDKKILMFQNQKKLDVWLNSL